MKNNQNAFDAINTIAPIFNNIFNEVLNHGNSKTTQETTQETTQVERVAAANILEIENGYEIQVAVPGFSKEEVSIKIDDNILVVSAVKTPKEEEQTIKYLKKEMDSRNLKRSFNLSNKIDKAKISAQYKDGILYVTVLKKENISFNINVE